MFSSSVSFHLHFPSHFPSSFFLSSSCLCRRSRHLFATSRANSRCLKHTCCKKKPATTTKTEDATCVGHRWRRKKRKRKKKRKRNNLKTRPRLQQQITGRAEAVVRNALPPGASTTTAPNASVRYNLVTCKAVKFPRRIRCVAVTTCKASTASGVPRN